MDVTVVVATFGHRFWKTLGDQAAMTADGARIVRVHGHSDLAAARNEGLAQVTTEWVCFLDADDALAPGYFDAMSRGSADVRQPAVSGWANVTMVPTCGDPHRPAQHPLERDCLRFGNPLCVGAVTRTELVRAAGGFDARWQVIEDYALWRALAVRGATFEGIPDATYRARVRRNPQPRNQVGGRRLRAATHSAIDAVLPWPSAPTTCVALAVVAHTDRAAQARALAADLGATLHLDDGTLGERGNHQAALRAMLGTDADWLCWVEDDALPVRGFTAQIAAALDVAPPCVVSGYLGQLRWAGTVPNRHAPLVADAVTRATATDAAWIEADALWHAVCVAIPARFAPDLLSALEADLAPTDEAVTHWARARHIPIRYTWPSLVEHTDTTPVTTHPDRQARTSGRVAWCVGGRDVWDMPVVRF